ncbi:hypothetical protein PHISCL_10203 [Aspergillus sclerotialis]|uniref:Uncharacterized protein n=1 Tax=Aspergillus sclerotialis TaxID=2070753 RepID=A0A3A2ZJW4_9EURO|nr:hypothetical protein PHISCL_10203 [Aspergillus sclerotialis]
MAPRTRSKHDVVVKPKFLFCCKCFRTSLKRAENSGLGGPLRIDCVMDAESSILCKQCSGRKAICETFPASMLGDCYDFAAILESCKDFWKATDETGNEYWADEIKSAVFRSQIKLAKGLMAVLEAHRRTHGFTETKKEQSKNVRLVILYLTYRYRFANDVQDIPNKYEKFLAIRRSLCIAVPYPGEDGTAQQWNDYHSVGFLRLLPGDVGYIAWASARIAFFESVCNAIEDHYGPDANTDPAEVEEMTEDFHSRLVEWESVYPLAKPKV